MPKRAISDDEPGPESKKLIDKLVGKTGEAIAAAVSNSTDSSPVYITRKDLEEHERKDDERFTTLDAEIVKDRADAKNDRRRHADSLVEINQALVAIQSNQAAERRHRDNKDITQDTDIEDLKKLAAAKAAGRRQGIGISAASVAALLATFQALWQGFKLYKGLPLWKASPGGFRVSLGSPGVTRT